MLWRRGAGRAHLRRLLVIWLAIEFVDGLAFGVRDSALALIRGHLKLSYAAIGLLLSAPALAANLVEIPIGLLADSPRRRRVVLAGGLLFTAALIGVALAPAFGVLLAALAVLYPASGAFVALSQADLMDADTARREHNMARWNLAGSLGALAGPGLLIAAVVARAGWRRAHVAMAAVAAGAPGAPAPARASPAAQGPPPAGARRPPRAALPYLARRP